MNPGRGRVRPGRKVTHVAHGEGQGADGACGGATDQPRGPFSEAGSGHETNEGRGEPSRIGSWPLLSASAYSSESPMNRRGIRPTRALDWNGRGTWASQTMRETGMQRPRIFVSTVSAEHGTTRQQVANVLTRLGYDPVWQDIFGTEPGDLRQLLRDKIDGCEGLIQIVGRGYGAEPPTLTRNSAASRTPSSSSFTPGAARRPGSSSPTTAAPATTPPTSSTSRPTPTTPTPPLIRPNAGPCRRPGASGLMSDTHLWHAATTDTELKSKVERLKDEFAELRRSVPVVAASCLGLQLRAVVLLVLFVVVPASGGRRFASRRPARSGQKSRSNWPVDTRIDQVAPRKEIEAPRSVRRPSIDRPVRRAREARKPGRNPRRKPSQVDRVPRLDHFVEHGTAGGHLPRSSEK